MVARRALIAVLGDEIEPDVLERLRLLLAARELGQLADQLGHLAELRDDVGQELLALPGRQPVAHREHLDVRPQARQRRPQLVRGVLHELALPLRGLVERLEHRVEGRGERADLVGALDGDPLAQVARRANALGGLAQVPERPQRRLRDEEARDRRRARFPPPRRG